jgi:hypothetical protein
LERCEAGQRGKNGQMKNINNVAALQQKKKFKKLLATLNRALSLVDISLEKNYRKVHMHLPQRESCIKKLKNCRQGKTLRVHE